MLHHKYNYPKGCTNYKYIRKDTIPQGNKFPPKKGRPVAACVNQSESGMLMCSAHDSFYELHLRSAYLQQIDKQTNTQPTDKQTNTLKR